MALRGGEPSDCIMCLGLIEGWWGVVVGGCRERSEGSAEPRASLVTAVSRLVTTVTFYVSFRYGLLSFDYLLGCQRKL